MVPEQLTNLRRRYGLPPEAPEEMLYRYLYLDYVPPALQFPDVEPQSTLHLVSGETYSGEPGATLPDWVLSLPDRPLVYVTAGTTFNQIPGYFETILQALAEEDVNVLVTTGRDADFPWRRSVPSNVKVTTFIPQGLLLPRCSLMVTHGGLNTVMGALQYGVPVLGIPIAADMGQNALRIQETGCGLCIPYHRGVADYPKCGALQDAPVFEAASVRSAVREILGTTSYKAAAAAMQVQIADMPPPLAGAKLLENLASSSRPQLQEAKAS